MSKIFNRQLSALNKKNWLIYKRNKCVILGELLLPVVIMMFIVSIRRVAKPVFNKEQSYENDGFYADQIYTDEIYMFKPSPFDCVPSQAVGIIGEDVDGILKQSLEELHEKSKSMYSRNKPYNTINFQDSKEFYNYIRQYKDVEKVPNITQLCFGAGISKEHKTYKLLIHSNIISTSEKAPFEQGDTTPKLFGGFQELKTSHMSTFTVAVSEVIAKRHKNDVQHEFRLGFVPRKTPEYHSDFFSSGMSQTFPPLVVVIYLIPFMNFFQKSLEEKVNKLKEYMKMMGMKDSAYNISWLIYYTLQILVVSIEMTLITYFFLAPHSNILLIFLFYFLYGLSLYGWIVTLVSIFNNVKTGSAAGLIIHFATYYFVHLVPKAASYSTR